MPRRAISRAAMRGLLACCLIGVPAAPAAAQTGGQTQPADQGQPAGHEAPAGAAAAPVVYKPPPKPPLAGHPCRTVTGASRGEKITAFTLPQIELLAPDGHVAETANPAPSLYYFVTAPVLVPMELTISAPGQPRPVLETEIPAPKAPGIYRLDLARWGVRLEPGIVYVWSVAALIDRNEPSRDIVASAALYRTPPDPATVAALAAAPPSGRAAVLAQAGLWYDAIAAAEGTQDQDRHAALDSLLQQAGLDDAIDYDRGRVHSVRQSRAE